MNFILPVAENGCTTFIIHARKAILSGLTPKQNREIPPLNYSLVYRLKENFPDLHIVINGGIVSIDQAELHLKRVDGVMMGRNAYQNPFSLNTVDNIIFKRDFSIANRNAVINRMLEYIDSALKHGVRLNAITRHMLGLFNGQPGARAWRKYISENSHKLSAGTEVIVEAHKRVTASRIT